MSETNKIEANNSNNQSNKELILEENKIENPYPN